MDMESNFDGGALRPFGGADQKAKAHQPGESHAHHFCVKNLKLLQASLDGYFEVRRSDGRITGVNEAYCEIVGYSQTELLSMRIADLETNDSPAEVKARMAKTAASGCGRYETMHRNKDGHAVDLEISSIYIEAEGLLVNFARDITERKLAEEALRQSRAQLNAFVRHAPMTITMLDRGMRYIAHSDRWQRDYGRGRAELIGLSHYDVYPDLPKIWMEQHRQALDGATYKSGEEMRIRDDGGLSWITRVVAPWRDEKGIIGGIIIAVEDVTERKLAESDLHKVLEECGDAIWITDPAGGVVFANPAALKLTGYSMEEICRLNIPDTVIEEHPGELADHLAKLQDQKFLRREWKMVHRNGSSIPVELTTGLLTDGRYMAFGRDLTETRRADTELRKLFQAVEQNPESILITNLAAEIEYVNQAFLSKTGYSREEVIGRNPRILHSGKTPPEQHAAMWAALKKGETWQGELHNRSKHGCDYTDFATISPIRQSDGSVSHYVAIQEDVTARKISEDRIHELAYFDQLTGLPNRILLQDRLNQLLTASARSGEHGALLFIDLDNFKTVNDTLGHHVGDQLLKQVGRRLLECARESDTVARFGGDEFVVLLGGLDTDESNAAIGAKTAALKMLVSLDCTYQLGDVAQHATASIGVTLFQGDRVPPADLLKQADLAMYQSKIRGRNLVRFFDPSLESEMMERSVMEEDLRRAIDEQQFQLHYQAQCDEKGELTGAEVLVRWQHPRRGLVSPALFIPFAEETGLILPIGEWVLDTACRQLAAWRSNPAMAKLTLAVNVSAVQFRQPNFVENVLRVVRNTGAPPAQLKLELTESMLVANVDEIIEKMLTLKKQGMHFSLDDFGTGYSSLSYLKRLPLDQLKIDQSFVKHVLSDSNDAAIASTIVTLAKSLGLGVIAEGVETEDQRQFLAGAGCNAYQGYLFSKPIPLDQFEKFAGG
jgi:diguanylate cyclase (GGDEF)-like protein/PAS domain S-box-containing protein